MTPTLPPQLDPGSPPLAPGPHLEADELSALLENALPEPERLAGLRHLAECPSCRELAFLAEAADPAFAAAPSPQPDSPPFPHPALAPAPSSRWSLRAIAALWNRGNAWRGLSAAALACCVLGLIFFQLHTRSTRQLPPSGPVAKVPSTPSLPGAPPAPAAVEPKAAASSPSFTAARRRGAPGQPSFAPPPPPLTARAANSVFDIQPQAAPASENAPALSVARPAPEALAPERRTTPVGPVSADAVPQPAPGFLKARKAAQASAPLPNTSVSAPAAQASAAPSTTVDVMAQAVVPLSTASPDIPTQELAPPDHPTGIVSGSVEVSAARISARADTPSTPEAAALPSKLPIAASAASGKLRLALDTSGALFRSGNRGKHWKHVSPPWPDSARSLQLTPDAHFQVTTAAGALWLSADGRHWSPAPVLGPTR